MKKPSVLMISLLYLFALSGNAQNIGGIVNSYATVTNISGANISVPSAAAFHAGDLVLLIQMQGATVDASNTSGFGDITSLGGAGTFEFLTLSAVNGHTLTTTALSHTYNFASGSVQVVRVPRFCKPTITSALTCPQWHAISGGGIIALEAGTLTLNADIDASEKGFSGGTFATSSFSCDNGNFAGVAGVGGGRKGESISAYLNNLNGLKGKQANGGGGGNSGNSGGGGGSNAGAGGFGGDQYSGCNTSFDERGIGGVSLSASLSAMFMGGGGGGGYRDNGLSVSPGANGGGIIYIKAQVIISNNDTITAAGGNVTIISDAEGAGGGGAGGTIFIECNNISGNLVLKTDGGAGGSNNNSVFVVDCHGTGGGGSGGLLAFTQASLPPGTAYTSAGGAAGTVNNPSSACFGTTNGATAGATGASLTGLPALLPALIPTTLSLAQSSSVICVGESASLTVSGGDYYSWSNGSASNSLVVSPTVTTSYTLIAGSSTANSCQVYTTTAITVYACTSIGTLVRQDGLNMYPNPTTGQFIIEPATQTRITICDETGRTLIEQTFPQGMHNIDLSNYKAGVYFVKATDSKGMTVKKLIKVE